MGGLEPFSPYPAFPYSYHASPEKATPIPSSRRLYPSQTKPYVDTKAETEESVAASELQLKKEAVKGFDIPGHCFYGDRTPFQVTEKYPLPDSLSTCRVLREGGNGVVLEVRNEFENLYFSSTLSVYMSKSNISKSKYTVYVFKSRYAVSTSKYTV